MTLRKNNLTALRRGLNGAIDRGVERGAGHIKDLAQQLCPVDEGDLKSTIRVEGEGGSRRRQVKAGGISGPNKYVNYAPYVEYGTARSPAQPFMHPAADAIDVGAEVQIEIRSLLS